MPKKKYISKNIAIQKSFCENHYQKIEIMIPQGTITFQALREKCPYLELFWCVFSRSRTEYGPE